ncbi:PP0621 family protein [Alcaligenaceae bacterium A4P071]|nr:PP0621 family protein [Alcaligenaceae bacterium B3P038]MDQ2151077.1 PP0621 family protein [Alcaligenaceae bacterium C4P045]MDQ2187567.1 PP0621 family protein [Alcaligenaceae bacterium A4P071]
MGDDAGRAQQWPRSGAQPPGKTGQPTAGRAVSESMVRCEYCGIHLPRSEALLLQGKTWCGEEHARLGGAQVKS